MRHFALIVQDTDEDALGVLCQRKGAEMIYEDVARKRGSELWGEIGQARSTGC